MLFIWYSIYERFNAIPFFLLKISNKMCVIEFLRRQLMTSWTLRFIFNHPLKQWPTGRKRGKDRNEKSFLDEIKSIGWLVGNAVSSETALRIFLIFCMKGTIKVEKWQSNFWKKFLIWRFLGKGLQVSPKSDTLIFFSKVVLTIFLVFGLKLVLNMTFNLNETYFLILLIWKKWKEI